MSILDDKLSKKEGYYVKCVNIEDDLYNKLSFLASKVYNASVSTVVNICIAEFAEKENIKIYPKEKGALYVRHTVNIRKSLNDELERLREKYAIAYYKLIEIALRNVIDEMDMPKEFHND
ncbi:MAG: hypothetical protein RR177_04035 [Oscillospiraceae bacterium]